MLQLDNVNSEFLNLREQLTKESQGLDCHQIPFLSYYLFILGEKLQPKQGFVTWQGRTRVMNSGIDVILGCFFDYCDLGLLVPHPCEFKAQLCSTTPAWDKAYFTCNVLNSLCVLVHQGLLLDFLFFLTLCGGHHPAPK